MQLVEEQGLMDIINVVMKNILISTVGKRYELVRAFRETLQKYDKEAKVLSTDMNPKLAPAAYLCDKCFQSPKVTDPSYVEWLLKLCVDHQIGMIIPTIDTELLLLAHHKKKFEEKGIFVIVPNEDLVKVFRDKRNTGSFFEGHHIRIPRSISKENPTFPLFAKPYDGSLSTNLHYIKCAEELTSEIIKDEKLMFMEYINPSDYKEYTIDMYYGKDGKLKCAVPRERIQIRAGEINKGKTEKGFLLEFVKERLNYLEGCFGCVCMQLFYCPTNKDVVGIELNPRFGGGYPLSYAAGANYPDFLIREYYLGEEILYFEDWKDQLYMLRYDAAVYI